MQIRVKQDLKTVRALVKELPDVVVEQIIGKTFKCPQSSESFEVPARLDGFDGVWSIPADCVEIVSLN